MPAEWLPDHESHRCRCSPMGPSVAGMTRDRARWACLENRSEEDEFEPKDRRRRGRGVPHWHDCPDGGRRIGVPDPGCSGLPRRDRGERGPGPVRGALPVHRWSGLYRHCPGAVPGAEEAQPRTCHGIGRLSDHRGRVPWPHRRLLAVAGDLEPGSCESRSARFIDIRSPRRALDGGTRLAGPARGCWSSASGPSATTGSSTSPDSSLDGCRPGDWWPSPWSWCPASWSCSA